MLIFRLLLEMWLKGRCAFGVRAGMSGWSKKILSISEISQHAVATKVELIEGALWFELSFCRYRF